MRAREVMSSPVISVRPDTLVSEIAETLLNERISAVPVVDAGGKPIGIVSEGDLLRRSEVGTARKWSNWLSLVMDRNVSAADFVKTHGTQARDVMSSEVITIPPDMELSEIATVLEHHGIKRVPVVENGRVIGIVSRANLLHGLAARMRRDSDSKVSDESIREGINRAFAGVKGIDHGRVNVVVRDGAVYIFGQVKSEIQSRALVVAAEAIPGVRRVTDNTRVDIFPR